MFRTAVVINPAKLSKRLITKTMAVIPNILPLPGDSVKFIINMIYMANVKILIKGSMYGLLSVLFISEVVTDALLERFVKVLVQFTHT